MSYRFTYVDLMDPSRNRDQDYGYDPVDLEASQLKVILSVLNVIVKIINSDWRKYRVKWLNDEHTQAELLKDGEVMGSITFSKLDS